MQVLSSHFRDVKLLRPARHVDSRGFFSEAYSKCAYAEIGIVNEFVQDNHSLSRKKGVLRGLHFQLEPFHERSPSPRPDSAPSPENGPVAAAP